MSRRPLRPFPPIRWPVNMTYERHPEVAETISPRTPVVNADSPNESGDPAARENPTALAQTAIHNQLPTSLAGGSQSSEVVTHVRDSPHNVRPAGPLPVPVCGRKRKLSDLAVQDAEHLSKREVVTHVRDSPHNMRPAGPLPVPACGRKRKLSDLADAEHLSRRVNTARSSVEPGTSHQVDLSTMAEISERQSPSPNIESWDTTNELRKTEVELFSALHENEALHAQIHMLCAKNEQLTTRLCDLQRLVETMKRFVDDAVKDTA